MATTSTSSEHIPAVARHRRWARAAALNWRLFVVRVVLSGIAVVSTVAIVPGLSFTGWRLGQFWVIAGLYAALVAVVKPVLEFVGLRFIVATYGLVVVVINAVVLFLLTEVFARSITYERLWNLLLGGLVVGVLGLVLETLAGATEPVLDKRSTWAES